ncbi:hypothetical protein GGI43DRAFT_116364 [Trichoderma evansii]
MSSSLYERIFFFFLFFFFLRLCTYPLFLHPPIALGSSRMLHCITAQPRDARVQQSVTSQPRGGFPNIYYFPGRMPHRLFSPPTQPGYPGCRPTPTLERVANVI